MYISKLDKTHSYYTQVNYEFYEKSASIMNYFKDKLSRENTAIVI